MEAAATPGPATLPAELGAVVHATRYELLKVEQAQATAIARLLASAEAEATRVILAAHTEAAALREAARSVARAPSSEAFFVGIASADAG